MELFNDCFGIDASKEQARDSGCQGDEKDCEGGNKDNFLIGFHGTFVKLAPRGAYEGVLSPVALCIRFDLIYSRMCLARLELNWDSCPFKCGNT